MTEDKGGHIGQVSESKSIVVYQPKTEGSLSLAEISDRIKFITKKCHEIWSKYKIDKRQM